ncbi:MAG: flagellar basal-body rod protein FlgG [Planctomycetes bacterium]|nr:flagellar basal-body rod protein FlgG [Planctomycetota bacterium]
MSVQTLYTAATGMNALETKLDVIANNMANINTTAFKKDRANFEDLIYRQLRLPGATDSDGTITSTGIEVGLGTRVSSTQTNYSQGAMQATDNPLDIAIEGNGFFKVLAGSSTFYSRAGNFGVNANGDLVLGSSQTGWTLDPPINIPPEASSIAISADGLVQFTTAASPETTQTAGQINLTSFIDPDGLLKMGDNLYQRTFAAGTITEAIPGSPGLGTIRQGSLEASNVNPTEELIDLITTQRAFELNSQVVQAGDQIMQVAANLRRG